MNGACCKNINTNFDYIYLYIRLSAYIFKNIKLHKTQRTVHVYRLIIRSQIDNNTKMTVNQKKVLLFKYA